MMMLHVSALLPCRLCFQTESLSSLCWLSLFRRRVVSNITPVSAPRPPSSRLSLTCWHHLDEVLLHLL